MSNDFLLFAYGAGSNKIAQGTYAAAPWVPSGFPVSVGDKTAYSNMLNKVWSQSSFMSHLLAAFISQQIAVNVFDDGDVTGKLAQLIAAVRAMPLVAIASASTTDLGAGAGGVLSTNMAINGAATINSFGNSAAGYDPLYFLIFNGTPTLVNSANLMCPNGVDLVTTAGGTAIVLFQGSGVWKILNYTPPNLSVPAFSSSGSIAVGANAAATGTQGSHGWERMSNGDIRNWTTIQLQDGGNGLGAHGALWNYDMPFDVGPTGINGCNLAFMASGSLTDPTAANAVLSAYDLSTLTQAQIGCHNILGAPGVGQAWFFVEVWGK